MGNGHQWERGIIDFVGTTGYLKSIDFEGWIVVEDECDKAITDPDSVAMERWVCIIKKYWSH